MRRTICIGLPVALIAALLIVGYLGARGMPGTSSARAASAGGRLQAQATVPAPGPGQKKVVLEGLGMVCPLCRAAVAFQLGSTEGIVSYDVVVRHDSATVLFKPAEVSVAELEEAIASAGFQVRGVREVPR